MAQFYEKESLALRPLMDVGNGHVLSTDYNSYSVQLDRSMMAEEGTLTFSAPVGLSSGDKVVVDFKFWDVTWSVTQRDYMADVGAKAEIVMPSPMPTDVPAYLADAFRRHHVFLANAVTSLAGNTITYRIIRPGFELAINSVPASVVAQAKTVTASNGSVPNVGAGGALFYRPEMNVLDTATITPVKAYVGYSTATSAMFYGVLRRDQASDFQFTDTHIGVPFPNNKCAEAVYRGKIQVPIEQPITTMPNEPEIYARYLADGEFGSTGSFRVVEAGTLPIAGMIRVKNAELFGVFSTTSVAIYLR